MSVTYIQLTAHDPIIARDGRPFGPNAGQRMRGLPWPLPSVVAGSLRTALVKAAAHLDFVGETPGKLMSDIDVAGFFPVAANELYLPAPNDCVWDEKTNKLYRARPTAPKEGEGADFPANGLRPVRLGDEIEEDFKAKAPPAWWPATKYAEWLTTTTYGFPSSWFDANFLESARADDRDHVCLDPDRGAAAESMLFATAGLNVTHLPRFGAKTNDIKVAFEKRYAEIVVTVRVTVASNNFNHVARLNIWHPLGGERRLVHWQAADQTELWKCPKAVKGALDNAPRIRMILATPAIFKDGGWRPDWIDSATLAGRPFADGPTLKLVGVSNGRWRAVSGWSLQPLPETARPGPKPIRRMVPAGSVYYFDKASGDSSKLADADHWLRPVSRGEQECRDGFGLALWGTW